MKQKEGRKEEDPQIASESSETTRDEEKDDVKNIEIEYLTPKKKKVHETAGEGDKLESMIKKQEKEIHTLKNKFADLKDDYLRQMAEKENLRKRLEREKSEFYQFALNELLKDFLGILDNFERALKSNEDQGQDASFKEGVEMIYRQLTDLLQKQGVTPIDIEDHRFDPHIHQALLTEESPDVDETVITEELQRGYKLHGRLLRPSLVKVSVPKKE